MPIVLVKIKKRDYCRFAIFIDIWSNPSLK
jgi:hypothetical protein